MRRPLFFSAMFMAMIFSAPAVHAQSGKSLLQQRGTHKTKLVKQLKETDPIEKPGPDDPFRLVRYPGPLGDMPAHVSKPADPARKNPAIIWLTGGFPTGGGGEFLWSGEVNLQNDQTASSYREAGMVMMFPTLRGGAAGVPGNQEHFYGEVNDVIAALTYLRKQPYVDPKRVYLGGHSTPSRRRFD